MPRFFRHIDGRTLRIRNEKESKLLDLTAARGEALRAARPLWAAAIRDGQDIGMRCFTVAANDGSVIDSVAMDEALPRAVLEQLKPEPRVFAIALEYNDALGSDVPSRTSR